MTAKTITLAPGTGGPKLLTDSLTTVDGAAAPADAEAQYAKMAFGAQNEVRTVSEAQPFPAAAPLRATAGVTGAVVNTAAAGDTTLVAAVAGQTTRVHRIWFVVGGATTLTLRRGATALTGPMPFNGPGSFVLDFSERPHFVTGVNEAFILASTSAAQVSGRIEFVTGA
jgi:hypothetical protein